MNTQAFDVYPDTKFPIPRKDIIIAVSLVCHYPCDVLSDQFAGRLSLEHAYLGHAAKIAFHLRSFDRDLDD